MLPMTRLARSSSVLTALLLCAGFANAQAPNVPIGGRTATMGACVAEGHDLAATLCNPAGLAAIPADVLELSATAYAWSSEQVQGYHLPTGHHDLLGTASVSEDTFRRSGATMVPSGVGEFRHLSRKPDNGPGTVVAGLSVIVPHYVAVSGTGKLRMQYLSAHGYHHIDDSVVEQSRDISLGPSFGFVVAPRFRLGVSTLLLHRSRQSQAVQTQNVMQANGTDFNLTQAASRVSGRSDELLAIAGAQAEILPQFWAGATIQLPTLHIDGKESFSSSSNGVRTWTEPYGALARYDKSSGDSDLTLAEPMKLGLGAAYLEPGHFGIAADVTFLFPRRVGESAEGIWSQNVDVQGLPAVRLSGRRSRAFGTETRTGMALGGEWWASSHVSLRAGLRWEPDARVLPAASQNSLGLSRRDYLTIAAGLAVKLGVAETTFGAAFQRVTGTVDVYDDYGTAAAFQTGGTQLMVERQAITGHSLMLLLAGAVVTSEDTSKPAAPKGSSPPTKVRAPSGHVVDATDGSPVEGAQVTILAGDGASVARETDSTGRFDLPAGATAVEVLILADDHIAVRRTVRLDKEGSSFTVALMPKASPGRVQRKGNLITATPVILFKRESVELPPAATPALVEIADLLIRTPDIERLNLVGFAGPETPQKKRQAVGEERARRVQERLVRLGVPASRLAARGSPQVQQAWRGSVTFEIPKRK